MFSKKGYVLTITIGFAIIVIIGGVMFNTVLKKSAENTYEVVAKILTNQSHVDEDVIQALKSKKISNISKGEIILQEHGYTKASFKRYNFSVPISIGLFTIAVLGIAGFLMYTILLRKRIAYLAHYLYRINTGKDKVILQSKEDDFSILQDELYKTVTELITTREQAIQNRQALADNLSDISHQIKTPLTAISLTSELAQYYTQDPKQYQYLTTIDSHINRIEVLVSSLLKLSKLDANTIKYKQEEIDVYHLILSSVEVLTDISNQKGVDIKVISQDEITFTGDFYWCSEALINIIKNCIEHTPKDENIYIDYEQNPLFTQITVTNTGKGIEQKDMPHIFERFYKGANSSNESIGIGLALSKTIVEKHNGSIKAENITSNGTKFTIKLYSK